MLQFYQRNGQPYPICDTDSLIVEVLNIMHDSYHDFGLKGFLSEIWKSNIHVKNKAAGQTREKFLFL